MTAAVLSAVETEQVRDLRSRLNRIAPGPLGDKSVGPLSKGFFDVCVRVGLPAGEGDVAIADLPGLIVEADMLALARVVGSLHKARQLAAIPWRPVVDSGVMQAVLTRRLVLAGRERPPETGVTR